MFDKNINNGMKSITFSLVLMLGMAGNLAIASDSDFDGVPDSRDKCADSPKDLTVKPNGCEILEEITLHLNFPSNSTTVSDEYIEDLGAIASKIERHFNVRVTVEGHTDWKGKQKDNKPLSEARARSVVKILSEESGLDMGRFKAIGYGELRPIADNLKAAGREKNRRVVIVIERNSDQ